MDGELPEEARRELLLHYGEIRDELSQVVRCPHLGADLAQEAYYRAFRAFTRRGRPRDTLAWLHAIARNVVRDHFRRNRRYAEPEQCDAELLADGREVDRVADAVICGVDAEALVKAVNALPPLTRALIVGFYFEGKGREALSIELGIRPNNVKVRLHRARKKLRDRLNKQKGGSP